MDNMCLKEIVYIEPVVSYVAIEPRIIKNF